MKLNADTSRMGDIDKVSVITVGQTNKYTIIRGIFFLWFPVTNFI